MLELSAYINIPEDTPFVFILLYFSFGHDIFLKLDGNPMGNSASHILANLDMNIYHMCWV